MTMPITTYYYSVDGLILPNQIDVARYLGLNKNSMKTLISRAGGVANISTITIKGHTINVCSTTFTSLTTKNA